MPTAKPRVSVVLDPATFHVIEEYAKALGASKSSVVASLCQAAAQPLARTLTLLQAATDAPAAVYEGLARTLSNAEQELRAVDSSMQLDIDDILGRVGGDLPKGQPPYTNRGVRSVPKAAKFKLANRSKSSNDGASRAKRG